MKVKVKSESESAQSCPTLCDPIDGSPPGSPVHGIFQAGVLEWVAIAFSRNAGDLGSIPRPGRSAGEGNGYPLQYSCLENLVGCSPWGREESDMTERLHFHFSLSHIGEGNGNPLQCSCLENPRDGGAWWAAIYGVAQSQTRLKQLSSSSSNIS